MRKNDALRVRQELFPIRDPAKSLLTFGFAPRESEGQGIDDTVADLQVARALGVKITTMHVAMGHYDTRLARVVQNLADTDLLAPDLVFSHSASFTDGELNAKARIRAGIVGTPDTELQMGMGYPVVFKARDAGCRVGLGLDIASNQCNDFVVQMRLAVQTQRGIENASFVSSPAATLKRTTADVLRMGTMGGAEVIHLENLVGSITPGKKADLVLFRCDDIDTVPVLDPVGTVVHLLSISVLIILGGSPAPIKGFVIADIVA